MKIMGQKIASKKLDSNPKQSIKLLFKIKQSMLSKNHRKDSLLLNESENKLMILLFLQ
jgi:hypothetical protein